MSAYIRKTDGVYISVSYNDNNMDDKKLRFTESIEWYGIINVFLSN
jgi:hypothetical protein